MRLTDSITPEFLEECMHPMIPDDPVKALELLETVKADIAMRYKSLAPIVAVFAQCTIKCGNAHPHVTIHDQVSIQMATLACIDHAIEEATKASPAGVQ